MPGRNDISYVLNDDGINFDYPDSTRQSYCIGDTVEVKKGDVIQSRRAATDMEKNLYRVVCMLLAMTQTAESAEQTKEVPKPQLH